VVGVGGVSTHIRYELLQLHPQALHLPRVHPPTAPRRRVQPGPSSLAGMACSKPGRRSRLIWAIRECGGRTGEPKSFGWRHFRDLVVRARIQLGGLIMLVWDNVRPLTSIRPRESGRWSYMTWATCPPRTQVRPPEP
jgi:hypothetical protein